MAAVLLRFGVHEYRPAFRGNQGAPDLDGSVGYGHGYDGKMFYLGLVLDEKYVEGWVEGYLERMGEDNPERRRTAAGRIGRGRDLVLEVLKAVCEIRVGCPKHRLSQPPGCIIGTGGGASDEKEDVKPLNQDPSNPHDGAPRSTDGPMHANGQPREGDLWLRSVVRNSSEIVSIVDPDGTVLYANPAWERVLGYDPLEAVGMNVLELV